MSNKKLSLKHRREMRLLKSGEKTKSNKVLEGKPKALDFLETTEALEDEEDKENGSPSFRRPTNLSRRNSTILAGNLSILDPDNPFHPSLREDYVTGRKPRRKPSIKYTTTAAAAETTASDSVMTDDLSWRRRDQMVEVTEEDEEEEEDDATFHTCRETLQVADVGVCRGDVSWLTDITTLRMEDMKISNSEDMKITDSAYDKALQVVSQQDQSQSFRLQLSESEASKGGFSNAHDKGSKKVDTDMEAITRKSSRKVAATPKTGVGVKASAFFSIGKRNDEKAGKNSNLLAKGSDGSDNSDDEEIVMSPKKLQFGDKSPNSGRDKNGLRSRMEKPTEKTVIFASESEDSEHEEKVETPQPNFLSQSRFASINSWVAKSPFHANITANLGDLSRVEKINDWVANSPFQDNSIADINDLLLTSDEDEPVAKGKIETPVNYQNDHRKINEKTVQSKVNSKTISQIALEQLNSIGIKSNKFKGVLKSKGNSQIESNVSSNAVSIHRKNDGGESCIISEMSNATSKHHGSWQDSRVTSDRTNVQSEEKNSMDAVHLQLNENDETGDGRENSQAYTERSSKAGCNWEDSQISYFEGLEKSKSCTERTSKAGGSLEESQPCTEKTGLFDGSLKESQPNTERTSKAGDSVEELKPCPEQTGQFDASLKESQPIIERTSKVGVNWEESKPFNTERTSKYEAGMVPSQSSVREENQNKKPPIVIESSGDSDDNLDNFLAKIISKNKSPITNNEDLSKFIVGDANLKESQPNTERTSKAGGSWEESQQLNTERTSKASGSWEESQQLNTESTSKANGSWEESQPNTERTSKAGGSWEESEQLNTERTSKAGGSWEESQPNTEITSKANGSREKSQPNTDSTCKTGRNWEESQINTQRTSKAGGSWEESSPNTEQACQAGSWEESQPNTEKDNKIGATCDEYQVNTGISDGCLIEIPEIGANGKSQSDSERTSKTIIRCEDSKAKSGNEVFNSAGDDNSNWEDEESHLRTVEFEKSIPKSTSSTSAFKTPKPKTSKNSNQVSKTYKIDESNKKNETNTSITWGPLENSRHGNVNTVRSWEDVRANSLPNQEDSPGNLDLKRNVSKKSVNKVKPGKKNMDNNSEASLVPSHSSVRVDNQNKKPPPIVIESSGDSDDNLDNFLAKITSKNKSPTKTNEDLSKFIVADEDVDSDEFATPKLSLKDRIMKGNVTDEVNTSSYRSKTQIPESESDDELPEIQPNPKKSSKPKRGKLRLPSSNETSENDEDDSPLVTRPTRKTGTAKKAYVIDSDSESSKHSDNDSPYYSDDPVNIYEPGQYHKIPPPSSPPRARLPVPKSIYRPVSPVNTKTSRPPPKTGVKSAKVAVGKNQMNQFHTPTLTFLSSLTSDTPIHRCHPEAKKYLTKFNNSKVELSKRLYQLYNTECFDSCLPSDFEISWNVRLTKTAGLCYSRRYRDRHGVEVRSSRIELSTKVIDSCDRLRDTLIHEMCHAASWIISGYRDGHGPLWKTWASKAMARFPELPVIDRCHSYAIRTKYTYKCEKCGYCIGRHSKSLDTARKVCGHCHGTFQLVVNYKGKVTDEGNCPDGAGTSAAKTPKTPNPFALFVKENYKNYEKPGVSHGDVMKMLGDKFKEAKISNK